MRIKSSVLFWYLRISRRATVPGRNLCGFLIPPVAGADLRAALVAICLRGAFPPVDLRAVCLVRAILDEDGGAGSGVFIGQGEGGRALFSANLIGGFRVKGGKYRLISPILNPDSDRG